MLFLVHWYMKWILFLSANFQLSVLHTCVWGKIWHNVSVNDTSTATPRYQMYNTHACNSYLWWIKGGNVIKPIYKGVVRWIKGNAQLIKQAVDNVAQGSWPHESPSLSSCTFNPILHGCWIEMQTHRPIVLLQTNRWVKRNLLNTYCQRVNEFRSTLLWIGFQLYPGVGKNPKVMIKQF